MMVTHLTRVRMIGMRHIHRIEWIAVPWSIVRSNFLIIRIMIRWVLSQNTSSLVVG